MWVSSAVTSLPLSLSPNYASELKLMTSLEHMKGIFASDKSCLLNWNMLREHRIRNTALSINKLYQTALSASLLFTFTANDDNFHTSCETKVWLCQSHVYLR